jgi:hypothetical protein
MILFPERYLAFDSVPTRITAFEATVHCNHLWFVPGATSSLIRPSTHKSESRCVIRSGAISAFDSVPSWITKLFEAYTTIQLKLPDSVPERYLLFDSLPEEHKLSRLLTFLPHDIFAGFSPYELPSLEAEVPLTMILRGATSIPAWIQSHCSSQASRLLMIRSRAISCFWFSPYLENY